MGTLEDVKGRGSFEAMEIFHYVWLSEGQPLAKADPAGFSPKAQGSCSPLASGGVTAFSPCWLNWGIDLTMFTQCSFVWGVARAKVWQRENPATVLVDFNMDIQPHTGPPRVWLASFILWHWAVVKLHPYSENSGQHIQGQPSPYLFITAKLQKYCSLYMAGVRNMAGACGPCSWDHPNSRHKCHLAMAEVSQSYTQGNLVMWRWPSTASITPHSCLMPSVTLLATPSHSHALLVPAVTPILQTPPCLLPPLPTCWACPSHPHWSFHPCRDSFSWGLLEGCCSFACCVSTRVDGGLCQQPGVCMYLGKARRGGGRETAIPGQKPQME